MADQNVPPRRLRDDRGWNGRQHPTSDAYRDLTTAAPYGASGDDTARPYAGPAGHGPQWVGPQGLGRQSFTQPAGVGLPNLDDDDDPGRGRVGPYQPAEGVTYEDVGFAFQHSTRLPLAD